jgi:hypothetical protein
MVNGVITDTAFHHFPTPEPQHFDFSWLERSAHKNDVSRFNQRKFAHGDLSQSLRVESDRKPSFLENSDPSLAQSNRVALNYCLSSCLQPMESPQPFSMGFARKEYTVIRVRNDHQTRLRNLAALFEFISNDVSYAFCALKTW